MEALSRLSPLPALGFIIRRPVAFLYNALILACFLSLCLLFRRRLFALVLAGSLWLILGIINCVLNIVRITPLGFYDFEMFFRNLSITMVYVKLWQLLLIALGILGIIFCFVLLFRRGPKTEPRRKLALLVILPLWGLTLLCTVPYVRAYHEYEDPALAYEENGFPYSLLLSAVDQGIDQPGEYNREAITELLEVTEDPVPLHSTPNFVFLQLESFLSADNYLGVRCSEDPTPFFTALRTECASGYLRVPVIGGGTANTEFEVVTGMSRGDFGMGEYPYSSVLLHRTCESIAFDLRELGYKTHAIHSNTAVFYQRNIVYPNLGFDTFTSLEYIRNYTLNELGWCRDRYLIEPIMDALESGDETDLVFTVTVQGHGMYSTADPEQPYPISTTGLEEDPGLKNAFEYYLSQLRETDDFLRELTEALRAYPEPVVLVLYGDHIPALDFSGEALRSGSLLTTEYVIWTNDGSFPAERQDLEAYQLAAHVFARYDITNGTLIRFHQQSRGAEDYEESLQRLEYDMLFGDMYSYGGSSPYSAAETRMGVREIRVQEAVYDGEAVIVTGENFTRASKVCLGDRTLDTVYVSDSILAGLPGLLDDPGPEAPVSVRQETPGGLVLSESESVPCKTW